MSKDKAHKKQHSAGGILFKKKGRSYQVCLISKHEGRVWSIPKGRRKEGETLEQTAEREILEETGHRGRCIHRVNDIHYHFFVKAENAIYHKTASFFLLELLEENACKPDSEAYQIAWLDPKTARNKLSYRNEKKILDTCMIFFAF